MRKYVMKKYYSIIVEVVDRSRRRAENVNKEEEFDSEGLH